MPVPAATTQQCFNPSNSSIGLAPGQTVTLPLPLCYQLGSAGDRIIAVDSGNDDVTIRVG